MVIVNGTSTDAANLQHIGLSQGFPFFPILYILFNANLVKNKINKNRRAIAFIDNYLAWVTSNSIKANIDLLQHQIILYAKSWTKTSGASFSAKKTQVTHFTQNKRTLTSSRVN